MTRRELLALIEQIEQQIAMCREALQRGGLSDDEVENTNAQIQRQQEELTRLYVELETLPEEPEKQEFTEIMPWPTI